jgi:hypothetical protein
MSTESNNIKDKEKIFPSFTELRIYPSFSEIREKFNAPQVFQRNSLFKYFLKYFFSRILKCIFHVKFMIKL